MKLVLVEDEEIIRTGLIRNIKWASLDIEVVGQAEDGEQAAALIARTRPDIVVTDIRIPFMDGLDLSERVLAKYPDTAIVIISGYDDFSYAQKALKLGVHDYILKPIDLVSFTQVLRKLCQRIRKRGREKREIEQLKDGAARSARILQERLFHDLATGRLSENEAEGQLPRLHEAGNWFTVIQTELDDPRALDSRLGSVARRALTHSLVEAVRALSGRGLFLLDEGGSTMLLCAVGGQKEIISSTAGAAIRSLRACCRNFPGATATIGIGGTHEGIKGLKMSCAEAKRASACRYILGANRTIGVSELQRLVGQESGSRLFPESELIRAVRLSDRDAIRKGISRLLEDLTHAGERAAQYLQIRVASIFMNCLDAVIDEGGSVEDVFTDPLTVYNEVLSNQTAAGALECLCSVLLEIAAYLEADRAGSRRHVIEKAKRYIRSNFGRFNLRLEEVAGFVRLSPSYLSSIFRENAGFSFIGYLTRLRMERAKELLLGSPHHAHEIADMVGYSSPAYFSFAFKKYAHCPPSQFRKQGQALKAQE